MSDLVEFLRARYAEARDQQMRTVRDTWEYGAACPVCHLPTESMIRYGGDSGPLASFKPCRHAVHDPALLTRFEEANPDQDVLADLDAKMAIANAYERMSADARETDDAKAALWALGLYSALRHLGLLFAAHPDYDERWRP